MSEIVQKHKEYLFPAVTMYYKEPIALVRGEGSWVWDDQGNKYLDAFGGVLTVSSDTPIQKLSRRSSSKSKQINHTSTLVCERAAIGSGRETGVDRAGRI